MAEDTQGGDGGQAGQQGQQNIQLLIDERELRTIFSNGCRIHTTADEVILDFGFNMPNPNPQQQQQGGQQQVLYKVYDRVIMSYANVKRLANSLNQLVRRYEQQFGELGGTGGGQGPRPVR